MMRDGAHRAGQGGTLRVHLLGRCGYEEALRLQETLLTAKIGGDEMDDLLLLEHPAVFTLGRGADEMDLLGAPGRLGIPVHRVGRGGGATFHGPGQLVAYPIVRLRPSGRDVHRYIRSLEQALVATCARFGVTAGARPGTTGVWVGEEKIASIGIGVRRGIACHGVALNVATQLDYFEQIIPCRAAGTKVTSLARQTGSAPAVETVAGVFAECLASTLGLQLVHGSEASTGAGLRASAVPPKTARFSAREERRK
jgi:lipoate-protein ligase B